MTITKLAPSGASVYISSHSIDPPVQDALAEPKKNWLEKNVLPYLKKSPAKILHRTDRLLTLQHSLFKEVRIKNPRKNARGFISGKLERALKLNGVEFPVNSETFWDPKGNLKKIVNSMALRYPVSGLGRYLYVVIPPKSACFPDEKGNIRTLIPSKDFVDEYGYLWPAHSPIKFSMMDGMEPRQEILLSQDIRFRNLEIPRGSRVVIMNGKLAKVSSEKPFEIPILAVTRQSWRLFPVTASQKYPPGSPPASWVTPSRPRIETHEIIFDGEGHFFKIKLGAPHHFNGIDLAKNDQLSFHYHEGDVGVLILEVFAGFKKNKISFSGAGLVVLEPKGQKIEMVRSKNLILIDDWFYRGELRLDQNEQVISPNQAPHP